MQANGPVVVKEDEVTLPTYMPCAADLNPMFIEKRVYQGSSGRVYPLPFIDRIEEQARDVQWKAVWLENDFVKLMILPEIGGRIHIGQDKSTGYDFFYRQNVIKPALVGLAGPWISGGVEFNWPQHHRPSTFMPVDVHVERDADGSVTVWCSEHEPMNRMKGMHGVCLRPNSSCIELKVRLYNRTALVQTFLWWANVATRVHEQYQSFFPPDVHYVADHAKRAMTTFPVCNGFYYGVDYRPGTGLDWYRNIPVPTSYMCMGTNDDFFGGYDHAAQAGVVHVANHHISPGKKQWTWGNHAFGYAWDRNLTDADGPYIELMAGVYTDNQPDFSFLQPYETKDFVQCWYPICQIGCVKKANSNAAVNLSVAEGGMCTIGVAVTTPHTALQVQLLDAQGNALLDEVVPAGPGNPVTRSLQLPTGLGENDLCLNVRSHGKLLLQYVPRKAVQTPEVPDPATEPAAPAEVTSNDELYLTGVHLEQYRHPTRSCTEYWQEALRRDPGDSRCNTALGLWHLRRGEFSTAEQHLRAAIARQTARNPNPYDGEAHYALGLLLRYMDRDDAAYALLYKATWNWAWQAPAFYTLAQIDCCRQDWASAEAHLRRALQVNAVFLQARDLLALVLFAQRQHGTLGQDAVSSKATSQVNGLANTNTTSAGQLHDDRVSGIATGIRAAQTPDGGAVNQQAESLLEATLQLDPLDWWAHHIQDGSCRCELETAVDIAIDYAAGGFYQSAVRVLDAACQHNQGRDVSPMIHYYKAYYYTRLHQMDEAAKSFAAAQAAKPDYVFPARLEDMRVLQHAVKTNTQDSRAAYYLGNLYYDRRRYSEAISQWETAVKVDPSFSIPWRNLGIAYFNANQEPEKSQAAYQRAMEAAPRDSRVLYEYDQLCKRLGHAPASRLALLEKAMDLVMVRDALAVEVCALYNQIGAPEKALEVLQQRRFQPWEGGEGEALGQWVRTQLALGQKHLKASDAQHAAMHFKAALNIPENLGEAKHLLANDSNVRYWLAMALKASGDEVEAHRQWEAAAAFRGDFQGMAVTPHSEMTLFSAMALRELGREREAQELLNDLLKFATELEHQEAKIDYFATSLPTMLLFDDDLKARQVIRAHFLQAQARLGLGDKDGAHELLKRVLEQDPSHAAAADVIAAD